MPIHSLLRMKTFTGRRYCVAVPSSWMFIWIEASPAMSITRLVRVAHLRADRGGQAIAHGAKAARGEPLVRLEEMKYCAAHIWCWPTSVAMIGLRSFVSSNSRSHGKLRHDRGRAGRIGQALARAPAVDPRLPFGQVLRPALLPQASINCSSTAAAIADDRQVDLHDLVDRGAVDIDVDLLELGENASSRPVTRSSNRAPMQMIRSAWFIAMLAS
jgi:hypothetical protein